MHWYIGKPKGLLIKSDLDVNFSFMLLLFFYSYCGLITYLIPVDNLLTDNKD